MFKRFKYRIYPTRVQVVALNDQLAEACRLYNAALQERRDAWRINRTFISFKSQYQQLKDIRAAGDVNITNYGCALQVLRRVDLAFTAFYRRVKNNVCPGFPRFKSASRYNSLSFRSCQGGVSVLETGKLRVQGIGLIKLKLHRPIVGKIKTATIKRCAGRWYITFEVECPAEPLPHCSESVGIDLGLNVFATLSNKTEIENPRWFKAAQARLRRAQRKVARRKKGSERRRKSVVALQRIHAHIRQQRADYHHKESRKLVNGFGLIAVEKLNVCGLAQTRVSKSVHDVGWTAFINMIAYKAESAGRVLVKVDPRGTTKRCSGCGHSQAITLAKRKFVCESCGLVLGRDFNAALNILRAGLALQASTQPVLAIVA